jgi:prepilin-type N-terminal cleavage/methylation domain-containing protein
MDRKGFTLIELLVVIAIIGLLASVVLASLNSVRAKGRTAAEKAEVKEIIKALELARSNSANDKYPLSASNGANWSCFKGNGCVNCCWGGSYSALPAPSVTELSPYLSVLPLTAVKADASCYAYDSFLYLSSYTSTIGGYGVAGQPGAWLLWAKESTDAFAPGECPGYDGGSYDCGLRYCYQYLGPN